MGSSRIRVIIVDDHELVRDGLAVLLEAFPDVALVGSAVNGQQAVQICDRIEVDVALMDLDMPQMGGILATQVLHERQPHVRAIALIGFGEEELVEEVMAAGAASWVLKTASIGELVEVIRAVAGGGASPLVPRWNVSGAHPCP